MGNRGDKNVKIWKNTKGISATAVIITIIIVAAVIVSVVFLFWNSTHYSINAGQVGVVVDQVGGIVRIQKGPLGWAEKAFWESVAYYNIMVQTEDMLSPTTAINGTTTVDPKPLEKLRYGAIPVNTKDVDNVYIDVSVQWHIDAEREGWQDKIAQLYLNYPGQDYETKTVLPAIRDAMRNYATHYTMDELAFIKREDFSTTITPYTQTFLNNITTLKEAIIIDKLFVRRIIPPENVQRAYATVLAARKEAERIMTLANATRDASIQVAFGQSIAIQMVVNATTESVQRLMIQNLTASEAIQYLGLQYVYDSLKKIAAENPNWKITLFINAPQLTYTIPVTSEEP